MSNTFTSKVSGRMTSRGWAIALGIGAIVIAAILLVVYLDRYRARVGGANAPTPVLVAKQYIPNGTPGTIIASGQMYAPTTLPRKEVEVGAIADPSYLSGRAAAVEIFPGQQLTTADFAASDTASVDSQITGPQRAISVGIDNIHGSLSQLQAGDSIDLYIALGSRGPGGQALVKLFKQNVKVLMVPSQTGPSGGSNLVLRIETKDAADYAYMVDNTQMYFVIRPVVGAKPTKPDTATPVEDIQHKLLERKSEELEDLYRQMDGRMELGVRALWRDEKAVFAEILAENADMRRLRDSLARKPPQAVRFDGIALGRMVKEALERKRGQEAAQILSPLRPLAEGMRENDTLVDRMVVNAAFLVHRGLVPDFDRAISELDRARGGRMGFKYVGPTPPYNFVNIVVNWPELEPAGAG